MRIKLTCITITIAMFCPTFLWGGIEKLDHELQQIAAAASASDVDVIVQYRNNASHETVVRHGRRLQQDLRVVHGGYFRVSAARLNDLANDPDVEYVSPDHVLSGALDNVAGAVNASAAWTANLTGSGIGVAVIDSGIQPVPDVPSSSIVYSQSFVAGDTSTGDAYGHGNHVAGILAGNATESTGKNSFRTFRSIADGVQIINLRVLNGTGQGQDSRVIAAIQEAITLKTQYNIRVINMSLGRPVCQSYTKDPLCQAVEQAWKAGIVVVVAAGNDGRNNSQNTLGYGSINAPGNDPYVITVGAMKTENTPTRTHDQIASYSSKGPTLIDHIVKPELVAPGNQVIASFNAGSYLWMTYPTNVVGFSVYETVGMSAAPAFYFTLSGTSMATPVVSAAAAILLQKNPSLTPDQVKARLMKTAYKTFPTFSTATDPVSGTVYTTYYNIFSVGAGYLDIQAALANTDVATGDAMSPVAVYSSATTNTTIQEFPNSAWSSNAIWGS
jgi:serine protease AprX